MAQSEFDLIQHYFSKVGSCRQDVVLGVGDDCALLAPNPDHFLAVSIDTLVAGVHFFPDTDPEGLGHKVLAVNLSDLAAMGADPAWATLALTLPEYDSDWLAAFSRGFARLAEQFNVQLVGGDTTRGALAISVQVHGWVEEERALRRDGASEGDLIYVTGTLGDAGLALAGLSGDDSAAPYLESVRSRLERPTPRLGAGLAVRGIASAGIDISDGLMADLGHICDRSRVGACVDLAKLHLSDAVTDYVRRFDDWKTVVASGDDYELCLTVPRGDRARFEDAVQGLGVPVTQIGRIEPGSQPYCVDTQGRRIETADTGYKHF